MFLAADALVQAEFSYQQPGIVRRTIASADDGKWLIQTIWDNEDAAVAATEAFYASNLGNDFVALIDVDTIDLQNYTPAGAA